MKYLILCSALFLGSSVQAQFHNLKIPKSSPLVKESQQLAVTTISLEYSSPSARGRKVWEDGRTIPQKGNPIAWRAGANLATTINFDTDVYVEGQNLAAGRYSLHVIPNGHLHQVLFSPTWNMWGSYYLDTIEDVALKVAVRDTTVCYTENLDYEFYHINDSTLVLGLEWADRRIPIEIKVDLKHTVLKSFRSQLRGADTYRWEAWNDAARWSYDHQCNLEEALDWVNHSIDGGYGGFRANPNLYNLSTKVYIAGALNKADLQVEVYRQAKALQGDRNASLTFASSLLQNGRYTEAYAFLESRNKEIQDDWVCRLDMGVAAYHMGKAKKGIKRLKELLPDAPAFFQERLKQVITAMEAGNYQYPQAWHLQS